MVPYREWRLFDTRSLKGYGNLGFATYDLWTVDHRENGRIGIKQISGSPNYVQERYDLIIRPTSDFSLLAGMDSPIDAVFEFSLCLFGKHIHSRGTDTILGVHLNLYALDDPDGLAWDKRLVTGRHYDGEDQWDDYPHDRSPAYFTDPNSSYGAYGYGYASWGTLGIFYHTAMGAQPYASSNAIFFDGRENFFKGGLSFRINNGFSLSGSVEVPEATEYWYFVLTPIRLNIHYFNPVVNSISRKWMPTTGGVELKLNGIAFDLTDAELSDATRHPAPGTPVGGWDHAVEYIYFEGLQNQGQYKLQRSALDFTVDSDSQITIPANKMPAMAAGTYAIRLKTWNITDVGPVVSWAGDWKAAADGRVSRSGRLIFRVGLPTVKASGMPLFGQYAPIDIRVKSAANLVLNGGFNVDASEWTASGGGGKPAMASVAGGFSGNCLRLTCDGTPGRYGYEKIDGLAIGEHYRIQGYFKKGTASGGFIKLGTTQGGGEIFSIINLPPSSSILGPYRKRIDLPIPDANLVDFPVEVPIVAGSPASIAIGAHCLANGYDIRFTAADGVTLLPYERESFAVVTGEATGIFWVKSDVSTAGTYVWLYYGNSAAPDVSSGPAVFGPTGSNHAAVYHMNDLTTSTIKDSTGNGNDGVKKAANEPIEAAGKVGQGQNFDGTNDYVRIADNVSINGLFDNYTVEAWIYVHAWPDYGIIAEFGNAGAIKAHCFVYPTGKVAFNFMNEDGTSQNLLEADALSPNTWYYFVWTYDSTTGKSYVAGLPSKSRAVTKRLNTTLGTYLGIRTATILPLDGHVDEVRFSISPRSAAWIKYAHANMNPADGGLTWGEEEILYDADWALYGANFLATAGSAYVSLGVEEANKTALFDEIWLFQGPGFYEGRLLSQSPVKRALDDNAGSGTISDMDLELANGDRFFSQQLATEFLKNQVIQTFQAWQEAAESEKSLVFTGSIDDYELEGDLFRMKVRDVTQTHFQKKIPVGICTSEEFPDIHPDEDGKPMPDILGRANFTTTEAKGAVRAIYIDTTIYRYLAARGSLHGVTEVYSDGTLMTLTTHYSIINDDLGRTYIQFLADQGEKKITFNAEGYVCTPMNSANGYVQNPAYIRLFFLNYLMELPSIFIDFESFDTLAAFYTAIGEHESGYLILQEEREAREVLAELSFTYGDTGFINKAGQYAVGRKGLKDITTEAFLFNQIDLIGHPKWKFNLNDAINYLKARFNYYPDPAIYKQAIKQTYVASRDKFGADVGEEIEMPWTTSATLISRRLAEELLRRGYGDKKCEFSVAIQWIDDLDLFTNIRLQDPFAIDAAGAGETGHYLYIEEMTVDQAANRIDIVAADYQWLLRQYCLLGDRDDLADNWATADESDRMWCYLCNRTTGYFADGEPGKVLADRNTF